MTIPYQPISSPTPAPPTPRRKSMRRHAVAIIGTVGLTLAILFALAHVPTATIRTHMTKLNPFSKAVTPPPYMPMPPHMAPGIPAPAHMASGIPSRAHMDPHPIINRASMYNPQPNRAPYMPPSREQFFNQPARPFAPPQTMRERPPYMPISREPYFNQPGQAAAPVRNPPYMPVSRERYFNAPSRTAFTPGQPVAAPEHLGGSHAYLGAKTTADAFFSNGNYHAFYWAGVSGKESEKYLVRAFCPVGSQATYCVCREVYSSDGSICATPMYSKPFYNLQNPDGAKANGCSCVLASSSACAGAKVFMSMAC